MLHIAVWLGVLLVLHNAQEIRFENGLGFLVNPITPSLQTNGITTSQEFYVYNQNTGTKVTASIGNIKTQLNLTDDINDYSKNDPMTVAVVLEDGANITAHLVHLTVKDTQPSLDVLFHSDLALETPKCMRVEAQRNDNERMTETCVLHRDSAGSTGGAVCLASVGLPYDWWSNGQVDVYFSVIAVQHCSQTSNYIRSTPVQAKKHYIGEALLVFDDSDYGAREVKEDRYITISVPQKIQQPGSQFSAAVKVNADSDLEVFVVRISTEKGIQLKSAKTADASTWSIAVDNNDVGATVTAFIRKTDVSMKTHKEQEVISCQFEVTTSEDVSQSKISWEIQYESSMSGDMYYYDQKTKNKNKKSIITDIGIAAINQIRTVAVLKSHEIVSLKQFIQDVGFMPVWLYAVDQHGHVEWVNGEAHCVSSQPDIIQVSQLCDMIYLSGETEGPGVVNIEFTYKGIMLTTSVRIWYPDTSAFIKLSDDRLNEVREWKVRKETNDVGQHDHNPQCSLIHQTSTVHVYTRFYTLHERSQVYMRGGKVSVFTDITDIVKNLIETGDPSVAKYENGVIKGVSKGRTEVKVVSPLKKVLATKDIKVSSNKVTVDLVKTNIITAIDMAITKNPTVEGLLTASLTFDNKLSDKHPVGVLQILVRFSDDTFVPLTNFQPSDYTLIVENETPNILAVIEQPNTAYRKVRAIGSGAGSLKITLQMDSVCQKKKSRQIAVTYQHIEVDISQPAKQYVNDAAYNSNPNVRWSDTKNEQYQDDSPKASWNKPAQQVKKNPGHDTDSTVKRVPMAGKSKQQPSNKELSPLETGMFVLMGVMGVVASVFLTNCLVYMYRQHKAKDDKSAANVNDKVSSGWVWLGRRTLEDNSITTTPEQLLSEKDFMKRCSRSDSLHSRVSKRSSCGTYRGSECSIRITVNPQNLIEDSEEDELFSVDPKKPVISLEEPESCDELDDSEVMTNHRNCRMHDHVNETDSGLYDIPPHEGMEHMEGHNTLIIHEHEDSLLPKRYLTQKQFDNLRETVA